MFDAFAFGVPSVAASAEALLGVVRSYHCRARFANSQVVARLDARHLERHHLVLATRLAAAPGFRREAAPPSTVFLLDAGAVLGSQVAVVAMALGGGKTDHGTEPSTLLASSAARITERDRLVRSTTFALGLWDTDAARVSQETVHTMTTSWRLAVHGADHVPRL